MVRAFAGFASAMTRPGYGGEVDVDPEQVERTRATCAAAPTVFLPAHRSNLDTLAMTLASNRHGLPRTHILGGINMNIWPLGPMLRRAGVIFIRRDIKDDAVYRWVLREYVGDLIEQGRSLEWYLEGGRSRSGKMLPPKLGLLRYVADAHGEGRRQDLVAIPVSITYDQLHEVTEYSAEARGGRKEREGLRWLADYYRGQRRDYGRIYVRYGEPIPFAGHVDGGDGAAVQRLALEVCWRINEITPITAGAVVCLALLATRGRAVTVAQLHAIAGAVVAEVDARELPVARSFDQLRTVEGVRRVASSIADNRTIRRHAAGTDEVFAVEDSQHHAAAFYRNTILHAFVVRAITELALVDAARASDDRIEAFWSQAMALRDLLKFEFFFAERDEFRAQVEEVATNLFGDWEVRLAAGEDLARLLAPPVAPMVLRSFLEADAVLAHALASQSALQPVTPDELRPSFMGIGEQFVLQRRAVCPESVSTVLFATAYQLAEHRHLTGGGADVVARRTVFVDEVDELLDRVAWLERRAATWLEHAS